MLTPQQSQQFHRDGFLLGEKVLTDDQVGVLQDELERVIREQDRKDIPQPNRVINLAKPDAPVWQILNIFEASEPYRKAMHTKPIVEAIAQLLDAKEVRLWHDQIQYKPAGLGGVNMWHQDHPYWAGITPAKQVTAWIALDDVDESNGCMSMVPGSHLWGKQIEFLHTLKNWTDMPVEWNGHKLDIKLCPAKKGHVHFHHSLTWHGSHANTSGRPRRAIAYHYMSEETKFIDQPGHPLYQFIKVKEGETLSGTSFPLVYQDKRVIPASEQPQLVNA